MISRQARLYSALAPMLAVALGLSQATAQEATSRQERAIAALLDDFHAAASRGDWQSYFDLMSEDAVFIGTDAGERWPKQEFRYYAAGSSGWTYTPQSRHLTLTPDGRSAWFDEILESASYGTSRGSGVLIDTADGWKISQYHLSFPVPNPLAREVTEAIKAFEAGPAPAAAARDVVSIDAILTAVYDAISGDAGVSRDWARFRSLFAPGASLSAITRDPDGRIDRIRMTPETYIERNGANLERSGFHEREIRRVGERYGNIAHAFSTYESRRRADDSQPFARGINSFQLMFAEERWWVVSIYWQAETEEGQIPERYLP